MKERTLIHEVVPLKDDNAGSHKQMVPNLVIHAGAKRVAEIGIFKGRLMRAVMRSVAGAVVEEWHAVDTWESNEGWYPGMGDQKKWDDYYWGVCKYMPWFKQLRVYRMTSESAAGIFGDGYFDMVYLDGDHTYEGVTRDIKAWLPKIRKGGLLAGHDYDPAAKYDRKLCDVDRAVDDMFGEDFTLLKCTVWYREVV